MSFARRLAGQIFLYARVVYAVVYLIGISWLRTGVWVVSVVGMALIAISKFQAPSAA